MVAISAAMKFSSSRVIASGQRRSAAKRITTSAIRPRIGHNKAIGWFPRFGPAAL
jgi:hypothetical protein